jgi:hypothetical protein
MDVVLGQLRKLFWQLYQKESFNGDLTLAFLAATQEAKKKKQDMFIVQCQQPTTNRP